MIYRTHNCGQLTGKDNGLKVILSGWTARVRDLGGMMFLDIRDRYGKTQIVADQDSNIIAVMKELNAEDVLRVEGVVRFGASGDLSLSVHLVIVGIPN